MTAVIPFPYPIDASGLATGRQARPILVSIIKNLIAIAYCCYEGVLNVSCDNAASQSTLTQFNTWAIPKISDDLISSHKIVMFLMANNCDVLAENLFFFLEIMIQHYSPHSYEQMKKYSLDNYK